jgi:predicted metalloprotease with PDZ domain
MRTELVWVYEGLTEYLGDVLAARSGFWTPERYRESDAAAYYIAEQEHRAGRTWRPLVDTAVSAPMLFEHVFEREWTSWRRGVDFYFESALIWLEADVIIRQRSNGRRSLDDFCQAFFGPPSGPPMVKPYTFDDLVAALNEVAPYDWKGFFQKRVYDIAPHVPLDGIEQAGWKLIYNGKPNKWEQSPLAGLRYSIGMTVQSGKDKEGTIADVVPGMAAAEAGIAPGMKLVAVDGQPWSPEILLDALTTPGTPPRLELLVENAGILRTYGLKYNGGLRHPHLERDPSRPDLLGEIIKPHALR